MTTTDQTTYFGRLVVTSCWCGIRVGVPEELYGFQQRQHRDGERQTTIFCPLGHGFVLSGEGEAARLRRKLDQERDATQRAMRQRDEANRRVTALKGVVTKTKKRAANGVCPTPDCHRSFVDVARHVRSKHPQLVEALN